MKILVINGPNLNLLGKRELEVYGKGSLADIERTCRQSGKKLGLKIDFRQTNQEGVLLDWIHEAAASAKGIGASATLVISMLGWAAAR